ncbi:MAG: hypothetical protein ABIP80_01855 [Ferruginibacter sp.]
MENEYLISRASSLFNNSPKYCIACEKQVRGRTDKKFCGEACRNNYNNRLKAETTNLVRNINHALGKNRRILEGFLRGDKATKVSASQLLHNGFQFKYFTHQNLNKKGNIYCFCYDYGYLALENNTYLLVKKMG